MSNNRAIMEKISSSILSGGTNSGLLNPEQSNRFIDYMVDESEFLKDIQLIRMNAPTRDLDYMGMNARVVRGAAEGVAPTELAGVSTSKQQLSVKEVILPYDLTDNLLEDNIERGHVETHVANLMAAQFGNDLCDLSINGDSSKTDSDTDGKFLKIGDGFIKIAKSSSTTQKFDTNASQDYKGVVFPGMLGQLPNQFKRRKADLRFYVSHNVAQAYTDQLAVRQTNIGDSSIITGNVQPYNGIKIFPCEYIPDDVLILTSRLNLATGVYRDIKIETQRQARKRLWELTTTTRIDPAKIIWHPACVVAYDIA